jgi:hypothetical protein
VLYFFQAFASLAKPQQVYAVSAFIKVLKLIGGKLLFSEQYAHKVCRVTHSSDVDMTIRDIHDNSRAVLN